MRGSICSCSESNVTFLQLNSFRIDTHHPLIFCNLFLFAKAGYQTWIWSFDDLTVAVAMNVLISYVISGLHFIGEIVSWAARTLLRPTFPQRVLFVFQLNGIFQRLPARVKALRLPPVQENRRIRRSGRAQVGTGTECDKTSWVTVLGGQGKERVCKMLMYTHLGKVQLGPSNDHRAFSSLVRCSWRKEMLPAVIAGLSTDAAMAGPLVVLTICKIKAAVSGAKIGGKW